MAAPHFSCWHMLLTAPYELLKLLNFLFYFIFEIDFSKITVNLLTYHNLTACLFLEISSFGGSSVAAIFNVSPLWSALKFKCYCVWIFLPLIKRANFLSQLKISSQTINRPGVAGAVLQTPLLLMKHLTDSVILCGNIFKTLFLPILRAREMTFWEIVFSK